MNCSAVLHHLLAGRGLTRADLRNLTALSTPTVSDALRRLVEAQLVTVVSFDRSRPGPNAEVYGPHPDGGYAVAVSVRDVGPGAGSPSLVGAVSDLTGGTRAQAGVVADFVDTDPVAAVADIVERLHEIGRLHAGRPVHLQLAVAGSYDPRSGRIHHVDVPGWNRDGLVGDIAARLGVPVSIDNDVNLAAVAERNRGVARDVDGFALLWLGAEGLGLAIDVNGALLRGARGGAGEIGYMPVHVPGAREAKADLQALVGGPAVLELARRSGLDGADPAGAVRAAREAAYAGFFAELAERVSAGLAPVVAVLDPPLIVLAGEVATAGGEMLRDAIATTLADLMPFENRIECTAISGDPVLLGALDASLSTLQTSLVAELREATD